MNISPSTLLPSLQQESRLRSESSHAGGEEIPSSEDSCLHLPATETNLWPTGVDGSTESSAGRPHLELPAAHVCPPNMSEILERDDAVGLSELVAGLPEGSTRSAADDEGSTLALLSPVAESRAPLAAEGDAPPSPELTVKPSVSRNSPLQSVSAREETEDTRQISPDTSSENLPTESQPEVDVNTSLIQPSVAFLTGVVSLSIVMQEPQTLFFIGLLLVLNRL